MRLPDVLPWHQRTAEVRHWLQDFNPDWLSLQFVPFGFHRKGLCFGLGKRLASMSPKASWHIMFHELWLGLGENSTVKHSILGSLQRMMILDLMKRLRPRIVNTQADSYKTTLKREKVDASILPLFSNIPHASGDGWGGILEPLLAEHLGKRPKRAELYLAGILGSVHPEWSAERTVDIMFPIVQRSKKRLVLVFHGRNNLPPEEFARLKKVLRAKAAVLVVGERSAPDISRILQALDLGLATSPRQIIQKSGSVAAMQEHGLPVLVSRDDWRLRGSDLSMEQKHSWLISPAQFSLLNTLPERKLRLAEESSVRRVTDQMLAEMKLPVTANVAAMYP